MPAKRKLLITSGFFGLLLLLGTVFFVGVHIGAKQEYYRESSFSAFKIMRDLEALRASQTVNGHITALIQEKETDLDFELDTVSTSQKNGLIWLNFLLAKSNDAVFLRSIADYRHRYPSKPMTTRLLTKEQQEGFLRLYSVMLREQNLLLEKYR